MQSVPHHPISCRSILILPSCRFLYALLLIITKINAPYWLFTVQLCQIYFLIRLISEFFVHLLYRQLQVTLWLQIIGTLVTVSGLFRNIPVRKNYLNSGRRAAEELKRVDNIVKSLAVIHPSLRVTFCHNKCLLWQKSACTSLRLSLMQVVGHFISSKLEELVLREAEASVQLLLVCLISIFWK